ncbi:MAG: hypothetical protein FJZ16_06510 [Candidatus Omnitrophica bacterium]|nr:hypothetical protein [Candidatus Omnitrophota bacterium]
MAELGLYIGPRAIEILEITKTVGGPKIINSGRMDLYTPQKHIGAAPISTTSLLSPQERIISGIKAIIKEKKIKSKEVISALPEESVTVRFFEMPRLPQKEWETAVRFEAKKYIPFKMEEIVSDFQVIENRLDPKKMSIIFVAAKREALNNQMFLLTQAGLLPKAIDIIPFSLKRLFQFTRELSDERQTTVIVNINQNTGFINILKEGAPCLIRDVSLTGENKEALYENLMGELRLSIGYFERQFPNAVISSLILCGNGDFEGWDVTMSNELKIPVKIASPLKSIKGAENISGGFEIVMGLALRGFQKTTLHQINLIADVVSVREQQRLYVKVVIAEAIFAILLLTFLQNTMLTRVKRVRQELQTLEKEGSKFSSELVTMSVSELEAKRDEIQKRLDIFKTFVLDRVYWTFKFRDLAKMLPEEVWLTDISLDERIQESGGILRFLMIEGISWVKDKQTSKTNEMALINTFLTNIKNNTEILAGFTRIEGINIEKFKIGYADATKFKIVFSNKQ